MPDGARISLRTVATEDGAEAYITVTSDEPIPPGTVNLASLSITPRYSGSQHHGVRKLHVQHVNGGFLSEPESVRISIADLAQNSPETTNSDRDIDLLDGSGAGDDSLPKIRLKIPPPDADPEEAPTESVSSADRTEDGATLGIPVRIAIADSAANDSGSSKSLEPSHRWKLHGGANHAATNLPQSIRIPM